MKNQTFGIVALAFGITALGLAVIPGIALDRPLPIPFQEHASPPPPTPEPEGGVTLKYKKLSITFGGGKKGEENEGDESTAAQVSQQDKTDLLLKWFTLSAVACSLIGLVLGPISWVREKQSVLAGSAIGISCLALVWQYVVIGIVVGVAIAILLTILGAFSG